MLRKWRPKYVCEFRETMSFSTLMFAIVIIEAVAKVDSQTTPDPCVSAIQIGQTERSAAYITSPSVPTICDDSLDPNAWYRFDGYGTGNKIPESCVELYHCGTQYPIWINGTQPTDSTSPPVSATVCSKTSSKSLCCAWNDTVQVKLCSSNGPLPFYVYQLKAVSPCDKGYCFGDTINSCNSTSAWNDIKNACSSPQYPTFTGPILSNPFISNSIQVSDTNGQPFNATIFSINCSISTTLNNPGDGARFYVSFFIDDQFIADFHGNGSNTFAIDEKYLIGKLGKTLTCKAVAYWSSSTPLYSPAKSASYWFGVKPKSKTYKFEAGTTVVLHTWESLSFWLEPTFPITTGHCYYKPNEPCLQSYTLYIENSNNKNNIGTASKSLNKCQYLISAVPGWDPQTNQFTIYPTSQIGIVRYPFRVSVSFLASSRPDIYVDYKIQSIPIQIVDNLTRPLCISSGDPHISRFTYQLPNSIYYHLMTHLGDFYLVNLPTGSRKFEVQVRHTFCCGRSEGAVCNCGVIVREGNNIIGINGCQPGAKTPLLVRYLTTLSNLSQTDDMIASTGPSSWQISLLSGIVINVTSVSCGEGIVLNIYVLGLNGESYGGLCGYNADETNFEQSRVPSGKSFFDFSRTNQPQCVNETEHIITCSCLAQQLGNINTISLCNKSVDPGSYAVAQFQAKYASKCAPNATNQTIGRRKRDIVQNLLNVLVDDSFLYTPPIPINYTISAPESNISRTVALNKCDEILHLTPAYNICSTLVNVTDIRETCIKDIQLTGEINGLSGSYAGVLARTCLYVIQASMVYSTDGSTDSLVKNLTNANSEVAESLCLDNCNSKLTGSCSSSGRCECYPAYGYRGKFCQINTKVPPNATLLVPNVQSIQDILESSTMNNVLLNINIIVAASNIDPDGMLLCKATSSYIRLEQSFGGTQDVPGYLRCAFTTEQSNLLDSSYKPLHSTYSFNVSISNDNILFSPPIAYQMYDNSCMNCDVTGNCSLQSNRCLDINNACSNSSQNTQQCKWTKYPNQHSFGASQAAVTTLDGCQTECTSTPYCDSIDFDNVAEPNGCWLFTNGNQNRQLYPSTGVDHYTLNPALILTTTTPITTSPAVPTPSCHTMWTQSSNTHSFGGTQAPGVTTLDDCIAYCSNTPGCTVFDFDTVANPNGCWYYVNTVPGKYPSTGVNQYARNASTPADPNCDTTWTIYKDYHSFGGTQATGVTSLDECKSYCSNRSDCTVFDFDTVSNPHGCWYYLNTLPGRYPSPGVNQYVKILSTTTTTVALPTTAPCNNTGSWTTYLNRHSFGATQNENCNTLCSCQNYCSSSASCVAFDFDTVANSCWYYNSAGLVQYNYPSPGVNQYVKVTIK